MNLVKIPESELEIMKVIWNQDSSISSKEIISLMEEKMNWKNTTTLTLLSRLTKKNFISSEKGNRITYYTAIVKEKDYLKLETKDFLKKFYNNSIKNFITTLNENDDISNEDLDELKKWINNR